MVAFRVNLAQDILSNHIYDVEFQYGIMKPYAENVIAQIPNSAYLQAPTSENHFIFFGPEFGLENVGKRAKIMRDLYGGKGHT